MDLHTIRLQLFSGVYSTVHQFAAEVRQVRRCCRVHFSFDVEFVTRQVWKNSMLYNHPESELYGMAQTLATIFEAGIKRYVSFASLSLIVMIA